MYVRARDCVSVSIFFNFSGFGVLGRAWTTGSQRLPSTFACAPLYYLFFRLPMHVCFADIQHHSLGQCQREPTGRTQKRCANARIVAAARPAEKI